MSYLLCFPEKFIENSYQCSGLDTIECLIKSMVIIIPVLYNVQYWYYVLVMGTVYTVIYCTAL
jgi:hypothetical protein